MRGHTGFRIIYPKDYHGQWEEECVFKGWLAGVKVRIEDDRVYALTFVDIHRLAQMLDDQVATGLAHYAEPGLVIVTELTRSNIEASIPHLVSEHFFDALCPIREDP
ncbi:MAG TPA: hypothetical protein VE093_28000 [Polyangiaceae bacterium]|jgi:hypothetical protein|nr:hypothetical protein [Polyangiaceae bacterium]